MQFLRREIALLVGFRHIWLLSAATLVTGVLLLARLSEGLIAHHGHLAMIPFVNVMLMTIEAAFFVPTLAVTLYGACR